MTVPAAYRETGIVRRVCGGGHYAFISTGRMDNIYAHHSRFPDGEIPEVGRDVRFTLRPDPHGWRAVDVEVL